MRLHSGQRFGSICADARGTVRAWWQGSCHAGASSETRALKLASCPPCAASQPARRDAGEREPADSGESGGASRRHAPDGATRVLCLAIRVARAVLGIPGRARAGGAVGAGPAGAAGAVRRRDAVEAVDDADLAGLTGAWLIVHP